MNPREKGFLLLTSHLGDPLRKVLTVPQLRALAQAVSGLRKDRSDAQLAQQDLMDIGFSRASADRILQLLAQEDQLHWYLQRARQLDCLPITRVSAGYPLDLRKRLGLDSPGCLWAKGDVSLLQSPMIALVGSRDLKEANQHFAREVGRQAALQGFTLVSGNARGADSEAQRACLEQGGAVISVVADELSSHSLQPRVLYLSEGGFDLPFSTPRALSRNRVIHALSERVLVAQCSYGSGGTWDGTTRNLKEGWSSVFCFQDRSKAMTELSQRGACCISLERLADLKNLQPNRNLFDQ